MSGRAACVERRSGPDSRRQRIGGRGARRGETRPPRLLGEGGGRGGGRGVARAGVGIAAGWQKPRADEGR